MYDLTSLQKIHGRTKELLLPSKYKAVIREQNGDDDDTLSNVANAKDATSLNNFIRDIVIGHQSLEAPLSERDVEELPLRDKYFILISSRVFSLGAELKFQMEWDGMATPLDYVEDITQFLWDYKVEPMPKKGEANYFHERLTPYPTDPYEEVEFTLRSGKEVRYTLMNGVGEKFLLTLPEDQRTINKELLARNLHLNVEGEWFKVSRFKDFNPKDMADIRRHVQDNDPTFAGLIEIETPTGQLEQISLLSIQDFFYPTQI